MYMRLGFKAQGSRYSNIAARYKRKTGIENLVA